MSIKNPEDRWEVDEVTEIACRRAFETDVRTAGNESMSWDAKPTLEKYACRGQVAPLVYMIMEAIIEYESARGIDGDSIAHEFQEHFDSLRADREEDA